MRQPPRSLFYIVLSESQGMTQSRTPEARQGDCEEPLYLQSSKFMEFVKPGGSLAREKKLV